MTANRKLLSASRQKELKAWGELDYLCKKIHFWLHEKRQLARARYYLKRLEQVLREVPKDDVAILRQDGLALFHELKGDISRAILHREKEIRETEWLHKHAALPRYDDRSRRYMLQGREESVLEERRRILEELKQKLLARNHHEQPLRQQRHSAGRR